MSVDLPALGKPTRPTSASSFKLQPQMMLFARLAGLVLARRAVGGRGKVRVAQAAAAALGDEHALADVGEIGELLAPNRASAGSCTKTSVPTGTGISRSSPSRPGLERAFALPAALGGELRREAEVNERVAVRIGDEIDRAALAAVAAVGAAARDELLAPEAEGAAAAVAGVDVDVDFVDEHGDRRSGIRIRDRRYLADPDV